MRYNYKQQTKKLIKIHFCNRQIVWHRVQNYKICIVNCLYNRAINKVVETIETVLDQGKALKRIAKQQFAYFNSDSDNLISTPYAKLN